jgi:hypothetical protein
MTLSTQKSKNQRFQGQFILWMHARHASSGHTHMTTPEATSDLSDSTHDQSYPPTLAPTPIPSALSATAHAIATSCSSTPTDLNMAIGPIPTSHSPCSPSSPPRRPGDREQEHPTSSTLPPHRPSPVPHLHHCDSNLLIMILSRK